MPKRYTSKGLIELAKEYGWIEVSQKGDHVTFEHPESRFLMTIVHPQKDVSVGRANDTVRKLMLAVK